MKGHKTSYLSTRGVKFLIALPLLLAAFALLLQVRNSQHEMVFERLSGHTYQRAMHRALPQCVGHRIPAQEEALPLSCHHSSIPEMQNMDLLP